MPLPGGALSSSRRNLQGPSDWESGRKYRRFPARYCCCLYAIQPRMGRDRGHVQTSVQWRNCRRTQWSHPIRTYIFVDLFSILFHLFLSLAFNQDIKFKILFHLSLFLSFRPRQQLNSIFISCSVFLGWGHGSRHCITSLSLGAGQSSGKNTNLSRGVTNPMFT